MNEDPIEERNQLTTTLTLSNSGNMARSGVVLQVIVPREMDLTDPLDLAIPPTNCANDSNFCGSGEAIRWMVGDMPAGSTKTYTFSEQVSNVDDGSIMTLRALVTSDQEPTLLHSKLITIFDR